MQAAFLRLYEDDDDAAAALMSLVPLAEAAEVTRLSPGRSMGPVWDVADGTTIEPAPVVEAARAFTRSLERVASDLGLDRLGDDGKEHLFAWCFRYVRARSAGSAHPSLYGPRRLSTARIDLTYQPDLVGVVPPPWRQETWNVLSERRADARARLVMQAASHIQRVFDKIEAEVVERGYVFPDTSPKASRDLRWLFRVVRRRETFQAIYEGLRSPPSGGVDTVRRAVYRMADRVGVTTTGWETSWK